GEYEFLFCQGSFQLVYLRVALENHLGQLLGLEPDAQALFGLSFSHDAVVMAGVGDECFRFIPENGSDKFSDRLARFCECQTGNFAAARSVRRGYDDATIRFDGSWRNLGGKAADDLDVQDVAGAD